MKPFMRQTWWLMLFGIIIPGTIFGGTVATKPIKRASPYHPALLRFRCSHFLFLRLTGSQADD
ncbi:hypothetical protein LHJMPILO_02236 [Aeromonas veronii]